MSEILDDITEFEKLWEKIKGHLVATEFKTPDFRQPPPGTRAEDSYKPTDETYEDNEEGYAPAGQPPTPLQLTDAGIEVMSLDYLEYGKKLKPKKFLGDKWSDFNQKLTALNYTWMRDGKESHWLFQAEGQAPPSPTVTSSPPKTDTVEWLIKDGAKNVEARAGDDKAWAFVKKYDRDTKKSTDEVKADNLSLYDFLKKNKEYVDGTYRYTMSKDEVFFSRQKI